MAFTYPGMSKRIVRVISYEGDTQWLDELLRNDPLKANRPRFFLRGTVKELQRLELEPGERLVTELLKSAE